MENYLNLPNFVELSDPAWTLGSLSLVVAYGACFAFSIYFVLSSFQLTQRYRLVAVLSAVVMISAGLSLFRESLMWDRVYTWDAVRMLHVPMLDGSTFTNAYRYGNWTITVPLLLTQLPIAMGLPRPDVFKRALRMGIAGIAMIWTGLVGQFGEVSDFGLLNLWGVVSTLFFAWLLWEVLATLRAGAETTPAALQGWRKNIWWYMLPTWGLYPLAYALPQLGQTETIVVAQQLMFTTADITTKLIYGVILARFCLRRSALEGHPPAIEALAEPIAIGNPAETPIAAAAMPETRV
ncbi:MAG: bacteriorhodopsin [Litorimonas sp.]